MVIENEAIRQYLLHHKSFTSGDFINMLQESGVEYSERKVYRLLQSMRNEGKIMKVGRGHYSKVSVKGAYRFPPSVLMQEITELIKAEYPLITFQTWEMYQWNEFVNHQISHNVFFIEVEHQLETTVFELLLGRYHRVLLDPDIENYYRYYSDDMIVVQRLVSGAPAAIPDTNQAALEKLLVDIFSRKLTGQLIERAEYRQIYTDAFGKYAINESALFRYAGRRHLEDDIRKFIKEDTDIELRSEEGP